MVQYISPVNPAVYPHLAVTLLGIGLFFMAWFFVYPHTSEAVALSAWQKLGALSPTLSYRMNSMIVFQG